MSKKKLADHLFDRIQETGVKHTFGIPGDFILPFYAAQSKRDLSTIVMTHEPSVGYAADAYGRLKGLGVALVTYGAGGLNMVNPVGLAYAEESPLLVISGGPETRFRSHKPQLHHCVKNFNTQRNVFNEVCESVTILDNAATARDEIDRVFDTTITSSKPGYIEIPRDMVNLEVHAPEQNRAKVQVEEEALKEAVDDIVLRLKNAKHPVLMVGVQVRRFGLKDTVVALSEALGIPVVTSILGKATFPESHANFIGNYFGQFGNPLVKDYVEKSDCIIALGAVLTEMETAGYTAKLTPHNLIQINASEVVVGYHNYHGLSIDSVIKELLGAVTAKLTPTMRFTVPKIARETIVKTSKGKDLSVACMIEQLNELLEQGDGYSVITDTGDCMYTGMSLKTDIFLSPGYYVSMGFGVPAAIGAQLAMPERRPIVLVGDGAFQMTGMEISTAVKEGLSPIIIVFNNASYAMLRFIDQKRDYYKLPRWDYVGMAKSVGANGAKAETSEDFKNALKQARESDKPFLIDAVIDSEDISPTLRRLTEFFSHKVKAAIS